VGERYALDISSSQDYHTIQKSYDFNRGQIDSQNGRAPRQLHRHGGDGKMQLGVPGSSNDRQTGPDGQPLKTVDDLNPIEFAKHRQRFLRSTKKSPAVDARAQ
jgi:hypothetical protein